MNRQKKRTQRGMTLLEVMIALSIFAVAAIAILQTITVQVKNLPLIEESILAQWAANNHMVDEFEKKHTTGTSKGAFKKEMMGRQFYWMREVTDAENDTKQILILVSDTDSYDRILAELLYYEASK